MGNGIMSIHFSSAAWSADVGDPVAKLVLLKLADNANEDGRCWPSIAHICRETQLSERTVQRKMRALELLGVVSSDRGKNRCDYFLKMEELNARLIDKDKQFHPVTQSPRHADTPSHSHPRGVTQSPQGCHTDGGGCHSDSYLTREPSENHHGTITEPSGAKKPKRAVKVKAEIDESKARGTIEELRAFALELGLTQSDADHRFYDWEENDWTKNGGKEKIRDWKLTFRKWHSASWFPSQKEPNYRQPTRDQTSRPKFAGMHEDLEIPDA